MTKRTTPERLILIEEKLEQNQKDHRKNDVQHDKILKVVGDGFNDMKAEFKLFKQSADKKYASKFVERIVYTMVLAVLVAVIGGIMNLLLK